MYFLTFDTSLDKTYITLFQNDTQLMSDIIESTNDKYHSAFLVQHIVDILKKHSLKMQDICALGVNIGPGSFTGIRACLTIARVIAQQLECPLVGVSSLEILSKINTAKGTTTVVLDARKGMCFIAKYDDKGNTLQEPRLEPVDNISFKDDEAIISDKAMHDFLAEKGIQSLCYTDESHDLGHYLGLIVSQKLKTEEAFNWAEVKPLYLQAPSITLSKKSLI